MNWLIGIATTIIVFTIIGYFVNPKRKFKWQGGNKKEWKRAKKGLGKSVGELAQILNISEEELCCFQATYTQRFIPKRSGGSRELLIPDKETKKLQRCVLHRLLKKLKVHPSATAFEKGKSTLHNALPHVNKKVVIKIDIVDFFPNTSKERIDYYFRRIGWSAEAAKVLCNIVCYNNGLPQGAPTSPKLSNLVNYYLDVQLAKRAARYKGHYTRYADDITFSFANDKPKKMRGVIQKTKKALKHKSYRINHKKTHILRQHQRQEVCGIVVNKVANLPRKKRRWLRAVLHHQRTGKPSTLNKEQTRGWLSYLYMVEARRDHVRY